MSKPKTIKYRVELVLEIDETDGADFEAIEDVLFMATGACDEIVSTKLVSFKAM